MLCDEAGAWRTASVVRAVRPSEVVFDGGRAARSRSRSPPPTDGGSVLTIRDASAAAEASARYWSRRLELIKELVRAVHKRREKVSQAVVVIHGIGEQQPGRTLRSLVASGVIADPAATPGGAWVKPDRLSESFELRTTAFRGTSDRALPNTDVFEFYWAHMIRDTTFGQVLAWARRLLLRGSVPRPLRPAWIAALGDRDRRARGRARCAAFGLVPWLTGGAVVVAASLLWRWLVRGLLVKLVGDAPRYLVPLPENIALRQEIRAAGVKLVQRLHEDGYDRIVILGHSLGSVIAYDIVKHSWIAMNTVHRQPHDTSFKAAVALERELGGSATAADVQALQHAAWRELRANTQPWLITDLVTVGSPLTYGDYLMADSRGEFEGLVADRVMPTCPPVTETEAKTRSSPHHVRPHLPQPVPQRPGDVPHVPPRGAVRGHALDQPVLQGRDGGASAATSSAARSRRCSGAGSATSSSARRAGGSPTPATGAA